MEDRRNHCLCLITKILHTEEQHDTILGDYEEAMGNRQPETMTTISQINKSGSQTKNLAIGDLFLLLQLSIPSKLYYYWNILLPFIII